MAKISISSLTSFSASEKSLTKLNDTELNAVKGGSCLLTLVDIVNSSGELGELGTIGTTFWPNC